MLKSIFENEVSLFNDIADKEPIVTTIKKAFIGDTYKEQVEAVRRAATDKEKKELKKSLPVVCVSAICKGGHASNNIERQTDIICLDFDAKDNEQVENFQDLKELIKAVPFVLYCGRSCGGNGFFVLMLITAPYRFAEQYAAALEYFKRAGLNPDESCKDITHLRYVTYDPEPYINENPTAFNYIAGDSGKVMQPTNIQKKGLLDAQDAIKATERVIACLNIVEANKDRYKGFADGYEEAQQMAFAFATSFGEAGRNLYHRYCAVSDKYTYEWAEEKYNDALAKGQEKVTIASFFKLCKDYGIISDAEIEADFGDIDTSNLN